MSPCILYSISGIPSVSLGSRALRYYVHTQQWLSELEFSKAELVFLQNLLADYSSRAADKPSRLRKLIKLDHELVKLSNTLISAISKLRDAVVSLEKAAAFAPGETEEKSAETFLTLEAGTDQTKRTLRRLKSELYNLIGTIIYETRSFAG